MRSNLFTNEEYRFKYASESELIDLANQYFQELLADMSIIPNESKVGILVLGAQLGVAGDQKLDPREKRMIESIFGKFVNSGMETMLELVMQEITDKTYQLLQIILKIGHRFAIPFLRYILCFAYADGVFEDSVADKLDGMFGMSLLVEFANSGEENVPAPQITLTGLEAEIVRWFGQEDQLRSVNDIHAHFSHKSKTEVDAALESLCEKNILYGGENMMNMYGLVDRPENTEDHEQAKLLEEKQRKQKEENERKEKIDAYNKEYQEWKNDVAEIKKQRKDAIEKSLCAAKEARLREMEAKYADAVQEITADKSIFEQKKTEMESKLASLGLFKFAEKRAARNELKTLSEKIEDAATRLTLAEHTYRQEQKELDSWLENKKEEFQADVERRYPLPLKPKNPYAAKHDEKSSGVQTVKDPLQRAILEQMIPGHLYTITELQNSIPELADKSNQRISALVRQLVPEHIERVEHQHRVCFKLAQRYGK